MLLFKQSVWAELLKPFVKEGNQLFTGSIVSIIFWFSVFYTVNVSSTSETVLSISHNVVIFYRQNGKWEGGGFIKKRMAEWTDDGD